MAAAFMARPGRLRNKVLFFLLLLLVVGCGQRRNIPGSGAEPVVPAVYVNEASGGFQLDSGILVRNGIPFTGYVFALNDRGDTLAVTPFYRGKEHGISRAYYPGGKIREMREFSLGKKIGIHRGWWPN